MPFLIGVLLLAAVVLVLRAALPTPHQTRDPEF